MKKSPLRILIVESSDAQRVIIEKILSLSGCFRVAPIESFPQLLAYTQYAFSPFDIVFVNSNIAIDSGVDVYGFCENNANIQHFVIYNAAKFDTLNFEKSNSKFKAVLPGALDAKTVQALFAMIDLDQAAYRCISYTQHAANQ